MAKPLSPKSTLIREAIAANPKTGNTELANLINGSDARKEDKIKVSAADANNQRQAMKALNGKPKKAKTKKAKQHKASASKAGNHPEAAEARPAVATGQTVNPVDLIDRVFDLADECGGLAELKRLVDRIAGVGR